MIKNALKISGLFAIIIAMFAVTTAFTDKGTTRESSGDNTCTVTVKYSSGSIAKNVKVTTEVSGGLSCIGGRDFYTDSNGKVTLKWSSGCYLKTVYVNGRSHKVDYKNDGSYTLSGVRYKY